MDTKKDTNKSFPHDSNLLETSVPPATLSNETKSTYTYLSNYLPNETQLTKGRF